MEKSLQFDQTLSERTVLQGNKEERIEQALRKAGWFPGRKVDISPVLDYYHNQDIELHDKAVVFFQEYYGIASQWYIEVTNLNWRADFSFELFPYPKHYKIDIKDYMYDDAAYSIESEEYKGVIDFSGEHVIMVGEIGYYYPAHVWIGNSGKLYATHEYNLDAFIFDTVSQLILYELSAHELEAVAMKP